MEREEEDYKQEIDKLKGEEIDVAFVPVDPRLKEYYYLAGEYFIENIEPDVFVPIHFWGKFEIVLDFADKMKGSGVEIPLVKERGTIIEI